MDQFGLLGNRRQLQAEISIDSGAYMGPVGGRKDWRVHNAAHCERIQSCLYMQASGNVKPCAVSFRLAVYPTHSSSGS